MGSRAGRKFGLGPAARIEVHLRTKSSPEYDSKCSSRSAAGSVNASTSFFSASTTWCRVSQRSVVGRSAGLALDVAVEQRSVGGPLEDAQRLEERQVVGAQQPLEPGRVAVPGLAGDGLQRGQAHDRPGGGDAVEDGAVELDDLVAVDVEDPRRPVDGRQQRLHDVGVDPLAGVELLGPLVGPPRVVGDDARDVGVGVEEAPDVRRGRVVRGVQEQHQVVSAAGEVAVDEPFDVGERVLDRARRDDERARAHSVPVDFSMSVGPGVASSPSPRTGSADTAASTVSSGGRSGSTPTFWPLKVNFAAAPSPSTSTSTI